MFVSKSSKTVEQKLNPFSIKKKLAAATYIDWDKCLALVSDNAYVMTGHKKGGDLVHTKQDPQRAPGWMCLPPASSLRRCPKTTDA